MTIKSKSFGQRSLSYFLITCMSLACGKVGSKNMSANFSRNVASAGILGGESAVEKPSPFDEKVLYLALGTKMETKTDGSKSVTWQGLCTASAISPRVILTAAHCVVDQSPQQLYIILEKNPGGAALNLEKWYAVESVQYHEKYVGKADGFQNDLALLRLTKDMPANHILKLAKPEQVHLPQSLVAVGFGTTSESSDPTETAKKTNGLHFVLRTVLDFDMDRMIFSIDQQDHKGFCSGDSGGPGLIYDNAAKEYVILGVVSNTSMQISKKNSVDPNGKFSLCIGQGNYTSVLYPDLRNWLQEKYELLQRPMFVTAL